MSTIRTFIAIEIPPEIQNNIAELQNNLKRLGGKISWTKPGNIHLTLKFLGDTDVERIAAIGSELERAAKSTTGFKIHVKGTGAFPNWKRPRVIWIGAQSEGEQLSELAEQIENRMHQFGFEKESRRFSAHLTLGRVKDASAIEPVMEKLISCEGFDAGSFDATAFYLIKSELHPSGSIYTHLKKIVI